MPFLGSVESTTGYGRPQQASQTPNVVTTGIVLYLDAGNTSSYSGSGTTWFDLTGNNRNATLQNAPTYSSSQGGYLSFLDTSFQYATVPDVGDLGAWTVEAWTRITASLTNKVTSVVCNQFNLSTKLNFSLGNNRAPTSYNLCAGFYNGQWRTTTGIDPTLNTWLQIVGTFDGFTISQYTNATLNATTSYNGNPQSGGEIRIARRWDEVANASSNFFKGDISIVRIYNRALTLAEITQNYTAQHGRYV